MHTNCQDYNENNYSDIYKKRYVTENRPSKRVKNYNVDRFKQGASDTQQTTDEYYTDHSYDTNKRREQPSYHYNRNKNTTPDQNLNIIHHNINYKNRSKINIQPSFKDNNNDIIRINTITYFSEVNDKTEGRSVSSIKNNNFESNKTIIGRKKINEENNPKKVLNRIELDNIKKNNMNSTISITKKRNTPFKISYKIRSNLSKDLNKGVNLVEQIARYVRRNEQNDKYMSGNESNLKVNCYRKLNEKEIEKEDKKDKYPKKSLYNNELVKINNYEFTYESDKGERNTFSDYKNRNTVKNNKDSHGYKYNVYYSNIDLEDPNKYNNNNYEEISDSTFNSIQTTKNQPYKYQIAQTGYLNNSSKIVNDIIDYFENNNIYNNINNKSITFGNINKRKAKYIGKTNIFSKKLKNNNITNIKNIENKIGIKVKRSNNKSIDINIKSPNNNNWAIRRDYITYSNISAENAHTINNDGLKKKENTSLSNHNSSRIKKKDGSHNSKRIKWKTFFNRSDIKKIILIQSVYRTHMLNLRISGSLNFYFYINKLYNLLKLVFNFRLKIFWKDFIERLSTRTSNKLVKSKKIKRFSIKKNLKSNLKYASENQLILKSPDRLTLHKEFCNSLNYANERSGLQLKLDNMIRENNELKNRIYDNKNIEEKLKQLLVENKKNQNINAIIMKDNQQLAKKLKNIQDNKNYKLVIQNQPSLDLSQEDIQIQSHSSVKLKKLYIKCLVLKKTLKNRSILEAYFNKYKNINNIKNEKPDKTTIENNNIFINNRKNINIQMTKNFNINFISQKDNYKHFILDKLFMKKEEIKKKILLKYFYKFIFISKYLKIFEGIKDKGKDKDKDRANEKENSEEKEKEIKELKIKEEKEEDESEQKRNRLQSIINKYERNYNILFRNSFKEWKLRSVIVKMKSIAKEIKKKKKLKKKIREKIAKANLKNLKNKTATFQSAHEFSYNIDKTNQEEEKLQNNNKNDENNKKDTNDNLSEIKEENKDENNKNKNKKKNNNNSNKNNNNENIIEEQDESESSFGLDD